MQEKILSFLNMIITMLQVYLNSLLELEKFEQAIKSWITSVIVLVVIGGTIVLSTWLTIQVLIFFYLITIPLSNLQAIAIIVSINLFCLLIVFLGLLKAKKKINAVGNASLILALNSILTALKGTWSN